MARPRKNAEAAAEPKKTEATKTTTKKSSTTTRKTTSKNSGKQTLKLELTNEQAQNAATASVAGEFNNWDKTANPMTKTLNGFEVEIELEKGKAYQFRFVLNGETWINDPYKKTVDNGFGELNSIIEL